MDGTTRVVLILIILVGLGFASARTRSRETDKIQVLLDDATKQAVDKGEFKFSDEIVPIESKDCEGTQWIKQQGCSLNGASMDGTEGSCGPGKEIWILDPAHPNFKPATGDGKCKPQERDCEVKCPKPCEGDTWKDSGKCVRKEYDTKGNVTETVLDGTEGKCGEGVSELRLDTTASDYKPAVGKGTCPMTKGGYCNVPCPKPEPPKCNSYTGWVENVGLGCVRSETDNRKVKCGEKGVKQFYNITTNPKHCNDLVEWKECSGSPCPINCEGSWSKWSEPKSDEPCGVQPYREMTFSITTKAQFGGYACDYPDGDKQTRNAGTPKECCIENNDWALKPGTCGADGVAIYTQTYKENKVGGCPDEVKSKKMACCYQKGDWTDTTKCNSVGVKSQKQTTAGNCPSSVKTRKVDCKYIGEWSKVGGCSVLGKQTYIRNVVNGTETTQKIDDCCFKTDWVNSGACKSNGKQTQTRVVKNCPGESATREVDCKYIGEWSKSGGCSDQGKQTYTRTVVNGTETTQKTENCCYKTDWTNSGGCSTEGKQRQTRTVKNCPGETSTRDVNCCYKTNWANSGGCSTEGKQRQTRTVKNCPGETSTRDVNCCYKTNWANSGGCSTEGKQRQTRTVRNCPGETDNRDINCCYKTNWANSGGCSTSGRQKQTRTVKNCPGESNTKYINCCYATGWSNSGGCSSSGQQKQTRTIKNCPGQSPTRYVNCEYVGSWYKHGSCSSDGKQWWKRTTANSSKTSSEQRNCCYEGPWKKAKINVWGVEYDERLIDKDASGNTVNNNSWFWSRNPNHWKKYRLETREVKNCPSGHPTERKLYKCGRGACRQYDKYWYWASQTNINTANAGSSVGSNCKNSYNCCERWEDCSAGSNDYIKGPKGTQGNYQYSY